MQKNDIIELEITDMGADGEGIGHFDGMTFFVKDAILGDSIRARIVKLKKSYGYARLEKLLVPSKLRCEPRCSLHRRCGGCQLQVMRYEAQLSYKQQKVRGNLIRLGGFAADFIDSILEPIVGMEEPYRYRNKAQFPIGTNRDGQPIAGFYAARTHSIIPVEDCSLGVEQNKDILDAVLSYMREEGVAAYDETTKKGLIRHVLIRCGFTSKELMVTLVINGYELPGQNALIRRLTQIEGMKSISINSNLEHTNVILGEKTRCIFGEPYITDVIHLRDCRDDAFALTGTSVSFRISPQSFYQVNPLQTEKLYSLALAYAGLTGTESVWDLYCGIGTISLFLAKKAGQVYGVEVIPQAIEDAKKNAERNGIGNAQFFVGKAEEVLPAFYERYSDERMRHPNVIVVDPPRKGCDEKCLDTILRMQPDRIVYVSCDSATLARDLRILVDGGYELRRVRPVDQFGQTVHVETVALLSKLHEAKHHVNVTVDMDELDLTSAESKATYEEIKQYVAEHNDGMKVSSLYIAQVKQKHGIIRRENYNKSRSEDAKQPQCPKEKEETIVEALKHFRML